MGGGGEFMRSPNGGGDELGGLRTALSSRAILSFTGACTIEREVQEGARGIKEGASGVKEGSGRLRYT